MAQPFPCVVRSARVVILIAAASSAVGCESLSTGSIRQMLSAAPETTPAQEAEYREKFQRNRDPKALWWLLSNRIENGMSRAEIEGILGITGRFEPSDRLLKTGNNAYLSSDKMFAFGPDSQSRTYFLVFRDNRLVGFDPKEFSEYDVESGGFKCANH